MGPIRKRGFTVVAAGVVLAVIEACGPRLIPGPSGGTLALPLTKDFARDAEGGGTVTVDVTILPGAVPDTNMAFGTSVDVATFINRGENGKKEKRYALKPREQAVYTLRLTGDSVTVGNVRVGKTRWELIETNRLTLARVRHRTGHLATCDSHPPLAYRDVYFKDCSLHVEYDPRETAATSAPTQIRFASIGEEVLESLQSGTPTWISCNSGCCSLGRQQ